MKDFLLHDNTLKVISVIAAFFVWIYVVGVQNPNAERPFNGIEVVMNEESGTVSGMGLTVLSGKETTVDVVLSGRRFEIASMDKEDVTARVDLNGIVKPGTYELPVEIITSAKDIEIVSKSVKTLSVTIDKITKTELTLEANIDHQPLAEGYILDNVELTPKVVEISGPDMLIKSVAKAVVDVEITQLESTQILTGKVVLQNSAGQIIENKFLTVTPETVTVTVPVLKTKQVPLEMNFIGPDGSIVDFIKYNIDPQTITIAGEATHIDAIENLVVGTVDTATLNSDISVSYEVGNFLPPGIKNISGVTDVTVTIENPDFITKLVKLTVFSLKNVPKNQNVNVITKELDVKLRGTEKQINNVINSGIRAVIDLGNQDRYDGNYNVAANIIFDSKITDVYIVGTIYTVAIDVKNG